jgi:acetyl esterase/lipase
VFWYGGAWIDGSKNDYRFVGTALAELGYVTVLPDYRLYPEVQFPAFIEDGAQAVKWVREHAGEYGGDPSRIVLAGHSAGAHLAALLALNRRYLRSAGVDMSAIVGLVGLSGPYDLDPSGPDLAPIFPLPATAADWQVLPHVTAGSPPALLLYGDQDDVVPRHAIDNLEAALRSVGGEVETRIYPNVDHRDTLAALSVPARARAPVLPDIAAFLARLSARPR